MLRIDREKSRSAACLRVVRPSGFFATRFHLLRVGLFALAGLFQLLTVAGLGRLAVAFALGGAQAHMLADAAVDFLEDLGLLFEQGHGVFAALTQALALVAEPAAGFFDN